MCNALIEVESGRQLLLVNAEDDGDDVEVAENCIGVAASRAGPMSVVRTSLRSFRAVSAGPFTP
ncbi:hypothetical protein CFP71_14645 [Amycolatopsis thailandensis]|uniref:Uncharacterized protein n=1 Tax=Amycolatopsis thailandensis TaxID=589330 RepID=A0A229SBF7_9PSEU|nr:hypothetical protein CFP71_14645 [Amycolatopsis thailandensis]